jgi:hypothetical protein
MKYILFLMFLNGCGTDDSLKTPKFFDKALEPYINKYMETARRHGVGEGAFKALRRVEFGTPPESQQLGYCQSFTETIERLGHPLKKDRFQVIIIRKNSNLGLCQFKMLMYHELSHCVFGAEHIKAVHIMRESILSESYCEAKWPELEEELFRYIKAGGKP